MSECRIRALPNYVTGLQIKKGTGLHRCPLCLAGKGHQLPFGKERQIRTNTGELLHIDICGPFSIKAYHGEYYFATFTDDATRFCWTHLLSTRDEITAKFIITRNYLKTQFNYDVKRIRGDNAGEHKLLDDYVSSQGIEWDPVPSYTPQLNGISEIKNRHLVEPLIAIMTENQLPKFLWGLLLAGVNHIANRAFHSKIGMTPYEALYGQQPDVSHIRALGCKC